MLKNPFETSMRPELEKFYENFDKIMHKIRGKIKKDDSIKNKEPFIFNFDIELSKIY